MPTQYGLADACSTLGCTYQWTGSQTSAASQMVNAMNTAIAAKVDGIAVCLVRRARLQRAGRRVLEAGIPVFAYNADAKGNDRLAYIGQDLYASGQALGQRIVDLVGEGHVVGFIATPGQLNIQPRLDGAKQAIKASGKNITLEEVATGPTVNEDVLSGRRLLRWAQDVKGMFAVDAGSTMAGGQGDGEVRIPPKACMRAASICCPRRSTPSTAATSTLPSISSPTCKASTP